MGARKAFLVGIVSLICFGLMAAFVDFDQIHSTLLQIPLPKLLISFAFIVINSLLALARFGTVLRLFDFRPRTRDLFWAFSLGQFSNQFFLNILGQSLTRAMILARAGVPFSASVAATYLERLVAAGLLFIMCLFGLWFLLRRVVFDLHKGGDYLIVTAGAMLVVACVVVVTIFHKTIFHDRALRHVRRAVQLWPAILLTLLAHGAMLAAYFVILADFEGTRFSWAIVAALTIVMFTASLPISFNGWGVRELSAATALSAVGLSPSAAVATAVAIGLLSMLVMVLFAAISFSASRGPVPSAVQSSEKGSAIAWDRILVNACAVFCAITIFFQVRVPLASNNLTVNMADLAAVTGAGIVALLVLSRRMAFPLPPFATRVVAGVSLLLLTGLMVALIHGVIGDWALINRGAGWIVLLGYVALAAGAVAISGEAIRVTIMQSIVLAGLTVCLIQFALLAFSELVFPLSREVLAFPFEGFVNNQNAFSLQLTMVAVLMVVCLRMGLYRSSLFSTAAFVLLSLTIYYTKSRTGVALILGVALWVYWASLGDKIKDRHQRVMLRWAAHGIVFSFLLALVLPYLVIYVASQIGVDSSQLATLLQSDRLGFKISHVTSEQERWLTIEGGWQLFINHPIFGAGLGAYVEQRLASGLAAQVIHSVPVWLLAETGLAGLTLVLVVAWLAMREAWRMQHTSASASMGLLLTAVMVVMAAGSLLHDFFYQRMFWFIFGLAAAVHFHDAAGEYPGQSQRT